MLRPSVKPSAPLNRDLNVGLAISFLPVRFIFQDMKWIEEKQALYRRNQELVEKVRLARPGAGPVPWEKQISLRSRGLRVPAGGALGQAPSPGTIPRDSQPLSGKAGS